MSKGNSWLPHRQAPAYFDSDNTHLEPTWRCARSMLGHSLYARRTSVHKSRVPSTVTQSGVPSGMARHVMQVMVIVMLLSRHMAGAMTPPSHSLTPKLPSPMNFAMDARATKQVPSSHPCRLMFMVHPPEVEEATERPPMLEAATSRREMLIGARTMLAYHQVLMTTAVRRTPGRLRDHAMPLISAR